MTHSTDGRAPTCAFVGDQSLVVRCVDIAREQGLHVTAVASHNPDVLAAVAGDGTDLVELGSPSDLAPAFASKQFDVLVSVAYLHIVPDVVIDRANAAINFHDGPLPDYAGLNVTSWAIANGESSHGVTWHLMTSDVDRGDIVTAVTFPIEPGDSALSLNARCFEAGAQSFVDVAQAIVTGELPTESQPDRPGHMYRRRERPIAVVDPQRSAAENARAIGAVQVGDRVLNTVGAAHLVLGDDALVVTDAEVVDGSGRAPGSARIDGGEITIATVDGDLVLRDVRRPDGRPAQPTGTRVSSAADLTRALHEHDPVLGDHEQWWRRQLGRQVDSPSLDELDQSLPPASASLAIAAEPAEVAAALTVVLAGRSDGDTLALGVVDGDTDAMIRTLAPLVSAPEARIELDLDRTASAHIADVGLQLDAALDHGPYLTDLIDRDPELRGRTNPPVVELRIGSEAAGATDSAALTVVVGDGTVEVRGHGSSEAIDRVAQRLAAVIEALRSAPDATLRDIELLTDADRGVLDRLNDTAVDVATDTIDSRFRRCAADSADRPAVSCAGRTVTYAELSERVDELSTRLRAAGVRQGDVVGIALERSIDLITSVLSVLSVGAAYLPLDPEYPADRLQFMVEDSSTSVVIGRPDVVAQFDRELVVIDPADRSAEGATHRDPSQHADADLAYVIYTSGSTGTPKGVQLEHRQVANFFAGMDTVIGDDEPGVWLAVTSLSFDISVLELLWTLTRGFHVVVKQDSGFQPVRSFGGDAPTMSLFHFAAGDAQAGDGYRILLESSRWGDEHGFEAVWTPERHFHDFGAPYPNPSVVAAAVAAITERIEIRAGSVVLPLHSPVRVAEEWSVVDNLSGGRVGISFAAGWQPNDFVLNPAGYANAREELADRIEAVRSLWRGETVELPGPDGDLVPVRTLPRPVQAELPVWLTSAGSPASFERAGTLGVNLLTHLLGQSIEQLAENIERYRAAYRAAGHDGEGKVTLMLHSFLDEDGDGARETAREPLTQYLGTAVGLIKNMASASAFPTFAGAGKDADEAFKSLTDADTRQLLEMAADRYLTTSGLFGTVDDALDMVAAATNAGVDEVACLIDFGIDADLVLPSLELLGQVHDRLEQEDGEIETVASLVERYDVTHLQCTPSLASMLVADPGERAALGRLRHMMVGGEALPTELARELTGLVSGRVTNMYGPTETTIWSLTHDLDGEIGTSIPIGTPIANTSVHVLDRHRRPVPVGVFGELFLGGDGVARGYLDRPELNAERFVDVEGAGRLYATGDIARVRADGIVEFAGRSDGQVKIRGHRIELGEIEAVLDQHESVARSVVVARGPGEPTLVAFVVAAPDQQPDLELLRKQVAGSLPAAMVPTHFDTIAALPLTPNGKVDRKNLPEIGQSSAGDGAGEVSEGTEATVAAEWTRQLGREVGRTDNFFDIGGHSLLAVNVFRSLADATGAPISLTDVFRFPTVQQFAAHLDRLLADAGTEPAERVPDSGSDRGAKRRRALARRGGGGA
ncbi:MupA/Atu3671 family FMN-dependent luciferase-like monooxygenase [Ilumatobacter sp.]|uniref:MupA/Atu3671 family FMN-dependent luciferase-like monooxygenase n=1 Tax=Ilumatobacter sp. TaxID=1967498 RepID=UPI003AF96580